MREDGFYLAQNRTFLEFQSTSQYFLFHILRPKSVTSELRMFYAGATFAYQTSTVRMPLAEGFGSYCTNSTDNLNVSLCSKPLLCHC